MLDINLQHTFYCLLHYSSAVCTYLYEGLFYFYPFPAAVYLPLSVVLFLVPYCCYFYQGSYWCKDNCNCLFTIV